MRVIDVRNRLGRWNPIDAAALVAVALLIVLGYGAFLLFRTPMPIVGSITPDQVFAQQAGTLHLTGEHFRPFLSVRLGSFTAPLLAGSPTTAEVNVEDLAPGTHDFVLFDEARELMRVPNAITVLPFSPPALTEMELQAVGAFVFLSAADAARITVGAVLDEENRPEEAGVEPGRSGPAGHVLAVLPPEVSTQRLRVSTTSGEVVTTPVPKQLQVPAIVQLRCTVIVNYCKISGVDAVTDALVGLTFLPPQAEMFTRPVTHLVFRIDELRPTTAPPTFESEIRPVTMEMDAVGDFINLSEEDAQRIRTESHFERPRATPSRADLDDNVAVADVLAMREPETGTLQVRVSSEENGIVSSLVPNTWQVPAILRLRCVVTGDQCRIGEASLAHGGIVPLTVPVAAGERFSRPASSFLFRIGRLGPVDSDVAFPSDVRAASVVRVKFIARPEVTGLPMVDDEDFTVPLSEDAGGARQDGRSLRAAIVSVDTEPQAIVATTQMDQTSFEETMATFEATVRVPVILTSTGWQYAGRPVKVGAPFRFEGRTYTMDGWVLELQVGDETRSPARHTGGL